MKLVEALKILQSAPRGDAGETNVFLACGFTPLHLQTFLGAHLQSRFPERRFTIQSGLYEDLAGNLERMEKAHPDAGAVVIEWPDLDPRLGIRHLGGWGPEDLPDIVKGTRARAARLEVALERTSGRVPLVLSMPSLPLPPVAYTSGRQASSFDLELRESVSAFAARVGAWPNVRIVNPQRLDLLSPAGGRLDVKSELLSGFPYKVAHASLVAELLTDLIVPPLPKKGLITDLDDTLWRGILGDDGVREVYWDLDHNGHIHGLYQQLLRSLAEAGVLIAVASKNNADLVDEVFQREDLILPKECLFPVEANWGPKSESVRRILRAWNVGPESVVFVDDSSMELAEVQEVHPEVQCLRFPKGDYGAAYELLGRLRDLFGKEAVSAEDLIRAQSIRGMNALQEEAEELNSSLDGLLERAEAEITVSFSKSPVDPRAQELINKTNQFSLNGNRFTDGRWLAHLKNPDTFLLVMSYRDKYGPLGKIAVLTGSREGEKLLVDTWVMSCRAFSRRVEHQCLSLLFERFAVDEIVFDFQATKRNEPLQEFFRELFDDLPDTQVRLSKELFLKKCPPLFHRVKELEYA